MSQGLIQVNVRNPLIRLVLILVLVVAGVWSYFVVNWYLGNTFAEYFDPANSNFDIARLAVSMAPKDPLTHWRLAEVLQVDLSPAKQAEAIAEYQKAVELSPNDYRFWTSLGIAYERMGEKEKAQQALQRAVDLAPSYAYPHWFLGNLYLRNARYDEAFSELRIAGKANPELQSQLFILAWQVYSSEPEAMKRAVGESAADRAAFALYSDLIPIHFVEGNVNVFVAAFLGFFRSKLIRRSRKRSDDKNEEQNKCREPNLVLVDRHSDQKKQPDADKRHLPQDC